MYRLRGQAVTADLDEVDHGFWVVELADIACAAHHGYRMLQGTDFGRSEHHGNWVVRKSQI